MFCVEINESKTLLIANAVKVEVVTDGTFNEHVKFLDNKGDVVCLYKLSQINGFYYDELAS